MGSDVKGRFPHYMIKEIHDQPAAIAACLRGRVATSPPLVGLTELRLEAEKIRGLRKVDIVAWGASRHAGLAAKYMIEELAGIPVEVDHAGEYRYRRALTGPDVLTVLITQSGETPDTVASAAVASEQGSHTVAICNVEGSTISRTAESVIYTHAGKEVSVAATKSFTTQLLALYLLAVHLAQARGELQPVRAAAISAAVQELPGKLSAMLAAGHTEEAARQAAAKFGDARNCLVLGRGVHFPIALEGALKLKETSYVHAEGYPAGEMKHGPNALIEEELPVIVIATRDPDDPESLSRYQKTLANMAEVRTRGGHVIAVANDDDQLVTDSADYILRVPNAPELLLPILDIVPLQLLAYHVAVNRGMDVDRPRNLSKYVQVE